MDQKGAATPIVWCETDEFSNRIYMKREDLLPFCFGGNKVRIAQEYFDDMDRQGQNCMVGYGNARSNLSRALAVMSAYRGVACFLISPSDEDGARQQTFNSRIAEGCGARFRYCTKQNVAETVNSVMGEIRDGGLLPYYIYGDCYGQGREEVPVRAYAKVYREIKRQEQESGIRFDYIFLPTGTGMTQSGLLARQREMGGEEKIVGISVARAAEQEIQVIRKYVGAYEGKEVEGLEILFRDEYIAGGYGKYNGEICHCIDRMMRKQGIPLDPTYSGKAFWGMCDYIRKQGLTGCNLLFLHTGGTPLFYDFLASDGSRKAGITE